MYIVHISVTSCGIGAKGVTHRHIGLCSSVNRIEMKFEMLPHTLFGLLERVRVIVGILIRCYNTFFFTCNLWIETLYFVRCCDGMLKLSNRWQQSRSIHFECAILLTTQTKLNREKVQLQCAILNIYFLYQMQAFTINSKNAKRIYTYRGQFINVSVRCTKRGQTNLLWELSKARIGQQWHMAEQFVATIWLWCVERIRWMSNVLCAMEHTKCQTGQKITRRQIASNRP